jgi:hypothetical protein
MSPRDVRPKTAGLRPFYLSSATETTRARPDAHVSLIAALGYFLCGRALVWQHT